MGDEITLLEINDFINLPEKDKQKLTKLAFSDEDINALSDEVFKNFCDGIAQCSKLQGLTLEQLNLSKLTPEDYNSSWMR